MGGARRRQPGVAAHLSLVDLLVDPLGEDLGAAAGTGVESRLLELLDHLGQRPAGDLPRQVVQLHHGEPLQVDPGADRLDAAQHLQVVRPRHLLGEAADDVDLGDAAVHLLPHPLLDLVQAEEVGVRRPLGPSEGAEAAAADADVGVVDVLVDHVVGQVAVPPLPVQVGQASHRQQIGAPVEGQAVLRRQPVPGGHLARHTGKAGPLARSLQDGAHLHGKVSLEVLPILANSPAASG